MILFAMLNILFAGLVYEDTTLTPEKVGTLIDEYSNITEIATKLGEAFTLAFGDTNSKNAKNPQEEVKTGE